MKVQTRKISISKFTYIEVAVVDKPDIISQKDWDAIAAVNDAIARGITYNHAKLNQKNRELQRPSETISLKTGICGDYAALFEFIMKQKGYTVRGILSEKLNHAWNEVYLSGQWWIVDTCWNAPSMKNRSVALANNKDIIRQYFLTTPEREEHLKAAGIIEDTHIANDLKYIDYEKTFEAEDMHTNLSELIDRYNARVRQIHKLRNYINHNVKIYNNFVHRINNSSDSAERAWLKDKIDLCENRLTEQTNRLMTLENGNSILKKKIDNDSMMLKALEKKYGLAVSFS